MVRRSWRVCSNGKGGRDGEGGAVDGGLARREDKARLMNEGRHKGGGEQEAAAEAAGRGWRWTA